MRFSAVRALLDRPQCIELLHLWLEAYLAIEALRRRPLGYALRRFPVPTRLAESIVALEAPALIGADGPAYGGDGLVDVSARVLGRQLAVAVKGSASGWISITATDRRADLLVWLDFSPLLVKRTAAIKAFVFDSAMLRSAPDRLVLARSPAPAWSTTVDARSLIAAPARLRCPEIR
jgi:hypothetical protein